MTRPVTALVVSYNRHRRLLFAARRAGDSAEAEKQNRILRGLDRKILNHRRSERPPSAPSIGNLSAGEWAEAKAAYFPQGA